MRWCLARQMVLAIELAILPTGLAAQHRGGIMYHAPGWSPDGQWILASANLDGDTEIYLVRADGGALRQLTRNDAPDDLARWSDDGRRIYFESERSGSAASYSMKPDGSDQRPHARDSVVARSPDGAVLLFESVRDGRGRLFAMRADRTGVREITSERHAEQVSFSPDGRRIAFEQRDALHDEIALSQVIVARPDGSGPKAVATGTDPSWSPDGGSILFKALDVPSNRLWISTISPTGEGLRRLSPGVHPTWSPDGARIAYMRDRDDGGADIRIMNRDGSGDRCVTCAAPFR